MPTYNGERFIAAALESVRGQHDDAIELVVVDDGSTDQTLDIVRSFAGILPVRLLTPGRLGNWVTVSNLGLREATGDWACFLHQDDLWLPGRLAKLRREMQNTEGALILHNAMYVGPDGQGLGPWTCPFSEGAVPPDLFIERLLIQNFIAIPSPVFRRTAVIDSGGLDESLWFSADWDLWLRLGAMGPVRFIDETLSAFRIHPASQTAARKLLPNEWEQQLTKVFAEHLQNWPITGKLRALVEQVGMTSIAVNSALAAASRGESIKYSKVLFPLLALGPLGWHRYLRDSRIVQRVQSRLKVQRLENPQEPRLRASGT
jgi:glycosyltransferase involved in cell wall biosynthesis